MDTKFMTAKDMARLGCGECAGCSDCCKRMGSSILLDPYDIVLLKQGLALNFEQLLNGYIELEVHDGLILPSPVMRGDGEVCSFLSAAGRCEIHDFRPGLCRLFPLGRDYTSGELRYFLLEDACRKGNRSKVKIEKWLGIPELPRYERFLTDWHFLLKDLWEKIPELDDEQLRRINMSLLQLFYVADFQRGEFYREVDIQMNRFRLLW